jgi:23S rRNA (uracil1939-C5)-methyltransferase
MYEHTPMPAPETGPAERRFVSGRYRVAVEALEPTGEARGTVIAALSSPSAVDLADVYGRADAEEPRTLRFVGALPSEVVEVAVEWGLPRPGRRRARNTPAPTVILTSVIQPSPARAVTPCPVFGLCGGCQLQHMAYPAQLAWKTQRVRDELAGVGLDLAIVRDAIGCEPPWGYRNHMRFSVNREGQPGLTARRSRRVLPLRSCPIAHPRINDALAILADQPLPRPQALLRYAEGTGQMLLQPPATDSARTRLEAAGIAARTDEMEERLAGVAFRIRPSSFFQTNTRQASRMAELVLARLPQSTDATLVDAYCGVGTFAALMAPHARHVIAIEESASAIRDAQCNLRDAPNVSVVQAKVEDVLPGMTASLDGLVIDPPRAGCQRPVLDALAARRVPRVIYVSCDPATLARDLAYLCVRTGAYRLLEVQPLDMFPQTAHIENIATLEAV